MASISKLQALLKKKYHLAIGEKTAEILKGKIDKVLSAKIKIAGISYKTGKKTTLNLAIHDLLSRP